MNWNAASLWPGAEGLGRFLAGYWPPLAVMAWVLLVLLAPAVLRARWPRARLTALVDGVARLLALPSRLVSAAHGGGARGHILWMVGGAVLLVVLLLNAPFNGGAATRLVVTPPPVNTPVGVDVRAAWPPVVLIGAAVVGLLAAVVLRRRAFGPAVVVALAGIGCAAALGVRLSSWATGAGPPDLLGVVRLDPWRAAAILTVLAAGAASLLAALPAMCRHGARRTDLIVAALLALAGMTVGVAATDFLALCAALTLMVICTPLLLRVPAGDAPAASAARAYVLTALVAGGLLVAGVALLSSAAGGTQFDTVRDGLAASLGADGGAPTRVRIGLALTLAALAFLIGAAPFGMHVPDVLGGGASPAAGLVVAAPAMAALLVLFGLMQGPLEPLAAPVCRALLVLGMVTIGIGALASWVERDVGRALGHLVGCLVGIVLVALSETAVPPLIGVTWVTSALAVMLVLLLGAGVLAGIACGGPLRGEGPLDLRAVVRRAVASGLALLLGLVALYAALMMLLRSGDVGGDEAPRRAMLLASALGLTIAGARWLRLFRVVSIKAGHGVSDAARFAGAGVFLLVLAVVLSPVWFIDALARAIELTWLK